MTTKNEILEDLIVWLNQRPSWLVNTINEILVSSKNLSDDDYSRLTKECIKESIKKPKKKKKIDEKIFKAYFNPKASKGKLHLNSISNVKGINNLNPRKPLKFGEQNLSIIYGRNGSGKSGYVRILKNACGARRTEELLPNVFTKKVDQECHFDLTENGNTKTIIWKPSEKIKRELQTIDIFDTSSGISYIMEENEATYEPQLMRFLSYLSLIVSRVSEPIVAEIKSLDYSKPKSLPKFDSCLNYKAYSSLNKQSTFKKSFPKAKWNATTRRNLKELRQKLADSDNSAYIKALELRIGTIKKIKDQLDLELASLSITKFGEKLKILNEIKDKEKEVKAASKLISGQKIKSIPSKLWRNLWEAAREFSNDEAYPKNDFPNIKEESNCVLCQQPILADASKRMKSLEEFVQNKKNEELEKLNNTLQVYKDSFNEDWSDEYLKQALKIANFSSKSIKIITGTFSDIKNRKKSFINQNTKGKLVIVKKGATKILKDSIAKLEKKLGEIRVSKSLKGAQNIHQDILNLEFDEWLISNKSELEKYIEEQIRIHQLNLAKSLCNTLPFSTKKSSLAEQLVSKDFIERFNKEIANLDASHLNVTIEKTKVSKAKVYHQIKLKGTVIAGKVEKVLSEGEFRIVSLAAFLADVTSKEFNAPFIFDDPISSLDIDYEEKTVDRIIELSKTRQVIVFTHRLSFLSLLNDKASKEKIETNNVSIISEHWGKGQPSSPILDSQRPKKALNTLIQNMTSAKKILETEGFEKFKPLGRDICTEYRIVLERIVEIDLIDRLVTRYRRSVTTSGRINTLVKINQKDVDIIDGMMTKYSIYEHSQSKELPTKPINPDDVISDMTIVRDWITEFKNRK